MHFPICQPVQLFKWNFKCFRDVENHPARVKWNKRCCLQVCNTITPADPFRGDPHPSSIVDPAADSSIIWCPVQFLLGPLMSSMNSEGWNSRPWCTMSVTGSDGSSGERLSAGTAWSKSSEKSSMRPTLGSDSESESNGSTHAPRSAAEGWGSDVGNGSGQMGSKIRKWKSPVSHCPDLLMGPHKNGLVGLIGWSEMSYIYWPALTQLG